MLLVEECFTAEDGHFLEEPCAAASRGRRDNFPGWLGGMIACVRMVNPPRGSELLEMFNRVRG